MHASINIILVCFSFDPAISPSANMTVDTPEGSYSVQRVPGALIYSVASGHKFGLTCESDVSFGVKWLLAEDDSPGKHSYKERV